MLYFETRITSGAERPRREFKRGEIAFLPVRGIIGFFLADMAPGRVMSPIGRVVDCVDQLTMAETGDVLRLYFNTG